MQEITLSFKIKKAEVKKAEVENITRKDMSIVKKLFNLDPNLAHQIYEIIKKILNYVLHY
jgi:hypothetical protein